MEGFLFIACIRFSFQLMLAESAVLTLFPRRKHFFQRLTLVLCLYLTLLYGVFFVVTRIPGDVLLVRIIYYTLVFAMTLCAMMPCFDLTPNELLFAGVCGYATQHMTYMLVRLIAYFIAYDISSIWGEFIYYWLPYMLIPLGLYWFVIRKNFNQDELKKRDPRMVWLSLLVLVVAIVISLLSRAYVADARNDFLFSFICSIYAILCCVLQLILIFYIPKEARLRHEYELMEQMIRAIDERHQISKKNVEIINRKCHDIKYQLHVLMKSHDEIERSEYAKEINDAISVYETIYRTDNAALDFVLCERGPICKEFGIQLSCIADGEALDFMQVLDITTLFGNALDNAIESVMQEEDAEKRLINLRVARQGEMVHIHIENYCKESVVFKDGLPLTTKSDKDYHGFGIKSICHIAEKYGGFFVCRQEGNQFKMDILCPLLQPGS